MVFIQPNFFVLLLHAAQHVPGFAFRAPFIEKAVSELQNLGPGKTTPRGYSFQDMAEQTAGCNA
jgi:hypothetical protein